MEPVSGRRENARGSGSVARTRPPHHPQKSLEKATPSGRTSDVLPSSRPDGRGPRRRGGGGGGAEGEAAGTAASPRTSRSPQSLSPTSKQISLGKMSGFGPGDGGWSERVESRRRQRLVQRSRGGASMVAEIDGSGKIQTVVPSAPTAPVAGHHQAVSPPRLRRLVHAEVRKPPASLM